MSSNQVFIIVLIAILLSLSSGYLYTNASKQAQDIKACQAVGAKWRYNSFNQVLCVPSPPQCKEYFKEGKTIPYK